MATKTVKNTDTENKEIKETKPKAEKPKATKKTEKEVQMSELPKQSTAEQPTADTTAVTVGNTEMEVYSADFVKQATKRKNQIKIEYGKIESSSLKIAFSLHWLYDKKGFKPLGYDTIYDLAKEEFNIARGTCNGFINLIERFAKRDEFGHCTEELLEQFEPYSPSKLLVMMNLTDEEIKQIPPDMSVREIKKKVKVLLSDAESTAERLSETGKSGFSQSFDGEETEDFEIIRQALITCVGLEDYKGKIDSIDDYITRALNKHPNAKIEIVLVTAQDTEDKEKAETEEADKTDEE